MAEKTVSQVQQEASQSQQNNAQAQAQATAAQAAPQAANVAAAFNDAWTRAISSGTAAMAPFTAPFTAPFQKAIDDQFARVSSMQTEFVRAESQGVDQMLAGIDEMTRLTKAGVQWYVTMATQGRQMTMDAARRSASSFTPAV